MTADEEAARSQRCVFNIKGGLILDGIFNFGIILNKMNEIIIIDVLLSGLNSFENIIFDYATFTNYSHHFQSQKLFTLPIAEILSGKNARTWVSMDK